MLRYSIAEGLDATGGIAETEVRAAHPRYVAKVCVCESLRVSCRQRGVPEQKRSFVTLERREKQ